MISFENVELSYADKAVLRGITLTIEKGEFSVLIGRSGCGKTTLLKLINGLHKATSGKVLVGGRPVEEICGEGLPARIGYVVQEAGLFPHLTAAQNIALAIDLAGMKDDRQALSDRVDAMLRLVNLNPEDYRDLYPSEMSGGQRQRVGIARALAPNPSILLMDEPFSALDPLTRRDLQQEIRSLQRTLGLTIVFVTHDMTEAVNLADRLSLLDEGRILQTGSPDDILRHPVNERVESFLNTEKFRHQPERVLVTDMMSDPAPTVLRDASLYEAVISMAAIDAERAFVLDDAGCCLGYVTATELRWQVWRLSTVEKYLHPLDVSIEETETLFDVMQRGLSDGPFPLPVLSHDGHLRGILTKADLFDSMREGVVATEGL